MKIPLLKQTSAEGQPGSLENHKQVGMIYLLHLIFSDSIKKCLRLHPKGIEMVLHVFMD